MGAKVTALFHVVGIMERIVDLIAPRTKSGFIVMAICFAAAINLLNFVVIAYVFPAGDVNIVSEVTQATAVGLPFVIFALTIIRHLWMLQSRLGELARTDMLTGLLNRRAFLDLAGAAHQLAEGGALLVLDADHFKRINDTYGHAAGDVGLEAIAKRIRAIVRADDVVGRLGGEEFAIYLPRATPEMAGAVGDRLCEGVEVVFPPSDQPVRLTMSAGAAPVRMNDTIEKMLTIADGALYKAKAGGRARIVFAPIEHLRAHKKSQL